MPKQHRAIYFDYGVCFVVCKSPVNRQTQKTYISLVTNWAQLEIWKTLHPLLVPWPGMAAEGALGATTQEFPLETGDCLRVSAWTARPSQMEISDSSHSQTHKPAPKDFVVVPLR